MRTLARADSLSGINRNNASRATSDLSLADTAMSSFADYITRAQELATQAANGTLTNAQRAGIGAELTQIHGNLVALANGRDSAGHSLFGGQTSGDAYTLDASGNAVYVGTATVDSLPLGEGQTVSRSMTGPEFLNFSVNGVPTDLMAAVKGLADALQGGSADPAGAARDGMAAFKEGLDALTTGQTLVGSRLAWIDQMTSRDENLGELRANEENDVGGTDIASTVAQLQQVMTVLEASQASFAKLANLSLFDVIR